MTETNPVLPNEPPPPDSSVPNDAADSDPVDGPTLLSEIVAFLRRFVSFSTDGHPLLVALWVLHTYAFEAAEASPYLLVVSPEKRSGKSRLLEVLDLLTRDPWYVAGVTEAVLFRKIEGSKPTLLLDEIDAVFGTYAERTEPIRAVLNAGNRKGACVARCVGPNHAVVDFSVYCPKVLAGIDTGRRIPDTVRDRACLIRLQRKAREPVERFRYRKASSDAQALRAKARAWALQVTGELSEAEPTIPDELNDRAAEGMEPLFAIAEAVDPTKASSARAAALELAAEADLEDESWGVRLLSDIREVLGDDEVIASQALCKELNGLVESPWGAWGKDRPEVGLRATDLSRLVRPFGIRPRTVRLSPLASDTAKGYKREQFEDAWERYLDKA